MSKAEMAQGETSKPSKKTPSEKKKALPQEIDKGSLRYLYTRREEFKKAQKLAQKEKIAETEINKSRAKLENFKKEISGMLIGYLNREDGSKGVEIKEYDFMSYITALTLKGNRVKWNEKEARKVKGGSIAYIEEKDGKRVIIAEYKGKKRVVGTVLEGFEKKKDQKTETPTPEPTPAKEEAPAPIQEPAQEEAKPEATQAEEQAPVQEPAQEETPAKEESPSEKEEPIEEPVPVQEEAKPEITQTEEAPKIEVTPAPVVGFNPLNIPKDSTSTFNPFNTNKDAPSTFDPLGKLPTKKEKPNPFNNFPLFNTPEKKEKPTLPNPEDFLPPIPEEPETPISAPSNDSNAAAKSDIPVSAKLGSSHSKYSEDTTPVSAKVPDELTHPRAGIPEVKEDDDEPIDPNAILIPLDNLPKTDGQNPQEIEVPLDEDEGTNENEEPDIVKMNEINFAEKDSYMNNLKITIQKSNLDPIMKEKALKNLEDSKILTRVMYKLQKEIKKVEGNKNVFDSQKAILIDSFNTLVEKYNTFETECKKESANIVDFLAKKDFNTLANSFSSALADMDEELKYNKINISSFENYFESIGKIITSGENTGLISNKLNEMLR